MPPGGTAGFAVTVPGSLPLTCPWSFHHHAIHGATQDSPLLTNVSAAHEGRDTVQITHGSGPRARTL